MIEKELAYAWVFVGFMLGALVAAETMMWVRC